MGSCSANRSYRVPGWLSRLYLAVVLLAPRILSQEPPPLVSANLPTLAAREANEAAKLLGLAGQIQKLQARSSRPTAGLEARIAELELRQEIFEAIQHASLDVDGVLAELSNERNQLGDLVAVLQNRRDRIVGRLNTAALIAGSGIAVAVGATQFPRFSDRTQTVGNIVAVAAGSTATLLSVLALRRQSGPEASVGKVPNMLAPLVGGVPVLNTDYPPAVMRFLHSVPLDGPPEQGTRLQQLNAAWAATGRLDLSTPKGSEKKRRSLTASSDPAVKVTIDDLQDRIAMLGDVMGRVSLLKRDLGYLMHMVEARRQLK